MKSLICAFALAGFAPCVSSAPIEPLAQKWVARYDGLLHRDDYSSVVAVDAVGDVYVAGHTTDAQENADACVIKYRGATGERLWEWHANQPGNFGFVAEEGVPMLSRLATSPDGNLVLMAGIYLYGNGWRVLKLRAVDGAVLWQANQPISVGGTQEKYVHALAVDANGDVFAGGSAGTGVTVKYASASGATLWQRRFGQSAGYSGVAVRALKVDANGDVLVTGHELVGSHSNAYTAKYAGGDGAVRWQQWLNDPLLRPWGQELALDASGNAIAVTHTGRICKYAAANGAQLWQRQAAATPYDLLRGR